MAFQPVPNAAQCIINYTDGVRSFSNSLWAVKSGFGQANMQDLATAIRANISAGWAAWFGNNFTQDVITVYDQRAEGAPVYLHTLNPVTGQDADEIHPLGDALVVTLRTATRGRSGRGRMYLGGLSVGQSADGLWSSPITAQAVDFCEELKADLDVLGWTWVVCSRYSENALRNPALTFPVTSFEVRSAVVGTQTRRNRRP